MKALIIVKVWFRGIVEVGTLKGREIRSCKYAEASVSLPSLPRVGDEICFMDFNGAPQLTRFGKVRRIVWWPSKRNEDVLDPEIVLEDIELPDQAGKSYEQLEADLYERLVTNRKRYTGKGNVAFRWASYSYEV